MGSLNVEPAEWHGSCAVHHLVGACHLCSSDVNAAAVIQVMFHCYL